MSWSKVKTILIMLFIFVNGFLIYNIYFAQPATDEVSQQTVADTVKILKNNNISVKSDIIHRKSEKMKRLEIENSINARSTLGTSLLGKYTETEEGYKSDSGKLTFSSVAFEYENSDKSLKKSNISDSNAIELAAEFLNEKGFDVNSSAVRDFSVNDDTYVVKFGNEIEGMPIYESYLSVVISRDGMLMKIEGYWPEISTTESSSISCVDATKVLINLLSVPELDTTQHQDIVEIQLGYSLGGLPESETPVLLNILPAYRIILKNGENYIFDAGDGKYLYSHK